MTSIKPTKPILIFIISAIIIFIIVVFFSNFSPNSSFNNLPFNNEKNYIELADYPNLDSPNLNLFFPHEAYINSDNWKSIIKINDDLTHINSVNSNKFQNFNILINDITVNNKYWNLNNLDSLNMLVEWVETFNIDKEVFPENSAAFKAIYNYWMGLVAKSLDNLIQSNYNLKFDFRVKYLRQRCMASNHGTGTGEDEITKIINNIVDQKWQYLFIDRMWNSTSNTFKFFIIVIMLITGIGYILFINYAYNYLIRLIHHRKIK